MACTNPRETPMSTTRFPRRVLATLAAAAVVAGSLIAAAPAFAVVSTIHVSSAGNDETGTGSLGAPYATLAKAVTVAADGDIISVASGTYAGATVDKDVTIIGSGAT